MRLQCTPLVSELGERAARTDDGAGRRIQLVAR